LSPRTGIGFDVHAFSGEGPVILGGIAVPHSRGLAGHSDADVVLHAITDAILGAAGLGDIGEHFPPSDPQWRGASSDLFLRHAVALVRAQGAIIDHVDCTIIAEEPKVGPHRSAMRARIAEIAGLKLDQVSMKATTTEGLGFTGRREGIAAQAVASIRTGF
jgi:2-C-methyl-D-erythritol 4-phosphate cytidylyltransferase/2-C-methyl-D-erythritol 2,4-cyclodiphosphate synthase